MLYSLWRRDLRSATTVFARIFACFAFRFILMEGTSAFPLSSTALPKNRQSYRPDSLLMVSPSDDPDKGISVGIDLGTTFSAIAYLKDEIPTIIPIPENGRTMPSVVAFLPSDDKGGEEGVLVGKPACDREIEAGGSYRNVKRVMGTGGQLSTDVAEVVPFLKASSTGKTFKKDSLLNQIHDAAEHPTLLKNSLEKDSNDGMDRSQYIRPELISSHILQTLKDAAELQTGQQVARAVIGVPAYFHDAQREATIRAAEMAGIFKVKLLREPEAAALAYNIGKEQIGMGDEEELVLVFDLGGGTFDVSMLVVGGGVTEIISTSGNTQLGGSVFDARIAQHCLMLLRKYGGASTKNWSKNAKNAIVLSSEMIRIYLSNNRKANLALPISEEAWSLMVDPKSVILPLEYGKSDGVNTILEDNAITSNSTHILFQLSRKDMERLCKEEFQAFLRPLREVAIMSGALLPGDTSPSIVEAALELEEEQQQQAAREELLAFDDFYKDDNEKGKKEDRADNNVDTNQLLELQEMDMRQAKKAQQRGRKKARNVAKRERKYRQEKRKLEETSKRPETSDKNVKVRDGISGRPISRVVLVGGATRMPGIGRLLAALTGVVPQKTVNPDEAVALGCAVHAGVLDGKEGMGTVLNPMQAAILRHLAKEQGFEEDDDLDDEEEFESVEYY